MYNVSKYHKRKTIEYECVISSDNVNKIFSDCADLQTRRIKVGQSSSVIADIFWLDGTVSGGDISETVIKPLSNSFRFSDCKDNFVVDTILSGAVYSSATELNRDMNSLVSRICRGCCALVFNSQMCAVTFEVKTSQYRSVTETSLEKSVKGSKESFTEVLRVNTALVRRRLPSPELKIIESPVGRKSKTSVSLLYFDKICSQNLVREVALKLDNIDIDAVLSTGVIEQYLSERPLSPFPQLMHTERPDRLAMHLMDGRVGILIDGLPVALILPVNFAEFMKVSDDPSTHFAVSTFLTVLRYLSLLLSVVLPALYVAIAMYHQEMIPTKLLMSIIDAKRDVPFSSALEIIGMLLAFAMLQEAGIRLPDPIGDTVSIIGALIVGQSAVEARIVSPIAIIVVAISGIACYTLPSQDLANALRLSRLILLLSAVFAGLFGISVACFLILLHLADIDSFGVNYTAPLSSDGGVFRMLLRRPLIYDKLRDPLLHPKDGRRQK